MTKAAQNRAVLRVGIGRPPTVPATATASAACRAGGGCVLPRAQAELRGDRPQRGDEERDVLVEVDAELFRSAVDLLAVHSGREGRLLQLLAHRLRLERLDAVGTDEAAGVDEAGELVAGKQGLLQRRVARQLQVLRMGETGLDDLLRLALLAQDRSAVLRVLVERRVDLVVEVVEERDAPQSSSSSPNLTAYARTPASTAERVPEQRLGSSCTSVSVFQAARG